MTIRIGFDGTPLMGPRSGVGHYTGRLLTALVDAEPGWEYLLYSNRPLPELAPEMRVTTHIEDNWSLGRWLWMQLRLPQRVAATAPDLCHYTNNAAPLRAAAPYVLTIHDASLFLHRTLHPLRRVIALRLLLPYVARRAAAVITVSQHARAELLQVMTLDPDRIHVVYEAAPKAFQPVQNETQLAALKQRYLLPARFILYVGTIEPRKNLRRLLEAFAAVRLSDPDVGLVIAGPPGWEMSQFEALRARFESESVRYLGYVPTGDLPGLYSLATCFAFPSIHEGFGLPPLEAMACGTPVVTSRDSAMAEVCGDAALLVNPTDVIDIAQGLRRLLIDDGYRQQLALLGLQRARTFSWAQAAAETIVIYRQVLAQRRAAALTP